MLSTGFTYGAGYLNRHCKVPELSQSPVRHRPKTKQNAQYLKMFPNLDDRDPCNVKVREPRIIQRVVVTCGSSLREALGNLFFPEKEMVGQIDSLI